MNEMVVAGDDMELEKPVNFRMMDEGMDFESEMQ